MGFWKPRSRFRNVGGGKNVLPSVVFEKKCIKRVERKNKNILFYFITVDLVKFVRTFFNLRDKKMINCFIEVLRHKSQLRKWQDHFDCLNLWFVHLFHATISHRIWLIWLICRLSWQYHTTRNWIDSHCTLPPLSRPDCLDNSHFGCNIQLFQSSLQSWTIRD